MLSLKKLIIANDRITAHDFKGNIRGEFSCENNKCYMSLFNNGISQRYRTEDFEKFQSVTICKNAQDAGLCMNELANMFFLTYKPHCVTSPAGWNSSFDSFSVSEIVKFFDTPMSFAQCKVQYISEARNAFSTIAEMGKKGKKLVVCLRSVLDLFAQMVMREEFEKTFGEKPGDDFELACICVEDEKAGENLTISWWWDEKFE